MASKNRELLGTHKDNKGMSQARLLSQFFTKRPEAQRAVDTLMKYLRERGRDPSKMWYVEPSAGAGVFVDLLAERVGRDRVRAVEVDPDLLAARPDYVPADLSRGGFLALSPRDLGLDGVSPRDIVVVGNPPYSQPRWIGRSGIISLQFVNKAMDIADTVAFVLGTTFRRPRLQTKINDKFHVAVDYDVPRTAFTVDGKTANVATVFQIWERRNAARLPDPSLKWLKKGSWGGDWEYVKSTDPRANVRVCHWGSHNTVGRTDNPDETARIVRENQAKYAAHVAAGKSLKNYDPDQSHFYLCARDPWSTYKRFCARKALFRQVADDRTMGQNPDLTKIDFVRVYRCDPGDTYSQGVWHTSRWS